MRVRAATFAVTLAVGLALVLVGTPLRDGGVSRAWAIGPCDVAGGIDILPGPNIAKDACQSTPLGDANVGPSIPDVPGMIGDAVGGAASDVAGAVGGAIFDQIASVTSDAATWFIGKIAGLIDSTTSPNLMSKGFLSQYAQMAALAALLAAAMLLLAVIEGIARGDMGMIGRVVVVNLPLAFIAMTSAYVVVQLLLGVTDQMSHAMAQSTGDNTHRFLLSASHGLADAGGSGGAGAAAAGVGTATDIPIFAVIIAALLSIVAGFFVWLELLMRDAAIYVVALFLPMALAASIWPRWGGALRRTAELLVAAIGSKFVIVSIISLAAGLLADNEGSFEQVIAAAALLLLACFAPLVMIRLVPFAEGAMASAYGRRSAAGTVVSGAQIASSAQMMRSTARMNWGGGGSGGGSGSTVTPVPRAQLAGGGGEASGGTSHSGGQAAAGSAGPSAAAPIAGSVAAARAAEGAGAALGSRAPVSDSGGAPQRPESPRPAHGSPTPAQAPPAPEPRQPDSGPERSPASRSGESPPRPPADIEAGPESRSERP